jgi:hypothetical protein
MLNLRGKISEMSVKAEICNRGNSTTVCLRTSVIVDETTSIISVFVIPQRDVAVSPLRVPTLKH